jgi:hypothetical protein
MNTLNYWYKKVVCLAVVTGVLTNIVKHTILNIKLTHLFQLTISCCQYVNYFMSEILGFRTLFIVRILNNQGEKLNVSETGPPVIEASSF